MAAGMTYDQYWYGDVSMAKAFYEADQIRWSRKNEEAWMYGGYVLRALDAIVGNFLRGKNGRPAVYPTRPIGSDVKKDDGGEEENENQAAVYARAYMEQMIQAGKNWGKKQG